MEGSTKKKQKGERDKRGKQSGKWGGVRICGVKFKGSESRGQPAFRKTEKDTSRKRSRGSSRQIRVGWNTSTNIK